MIRSGIAVTGRAADLDDVQPPPDRAAADASIYTHRSQPLSAIARAMLKDSINLYGEALMRLNAASGAPATNDAALDGLRKRLAAWGIPKDGEHLVDGSGLSRRDLIAPETLSRAAQEGVRTGRAVAVRERRCRSPAWTARSPPA